MIIEYNVNYNIIMIEFWFGKFNEIFNRINGKFEIGIKNVFLRFLSICRSLLFNGFLVFVFNFFLCL